MPKSDSERVVDVLVHWSGERPKDFDEVLINLWERTRKSPRSPHTSIDFQPDGVDDLIEKLKREFRMAPGRDIDLSPKSFDPNGRVKKVSDLMDAVAASDLSEIAAPVGADTVTATMSAAIDDETKRLYRALAEWCGDRPMHMFEPLIELWERTRSSVAHNHKKVPFHPQGATRLLKGLKNEYRKAHDPKVESIVDDFAPIGEINDADDLLRRLHGMSTPSKSSAKPTKKERN